MNTLMFRNYIGSHCGKSNADNSMPNKVVHLPERTSRSIHTPTLNGLDDRLKEETQ